MPVYEYECTSCGQTFERLQNVSARAPRTCPYCSKPGTVRRRVSAPSFQFKGSGWYVTDYAAKGKGGTKGEGTPTESGGDDKPATSDDKKPEKAEPKPAKAPAKGDD